MANRRGGSPAARTALAALTALVSACSVIAGLGPEKSQASTNAPVDAAPIDATGDASTPDATAADAAPVILSGCRIFPPDNPWNRDISGDPVDDDAMTTIFPNMVPATGLHPDWGTLEEQAGIPINAGAGSPSPVTFTGALGSQSDRVACPDGGPNCYAIVPGAVIEPATDGHLVALDTSGAPNDCTLYEMIGASREATGWSADHGAVFHLGSNTLHPDGFSSADLAGLPILAGLARYTETRDGDIRHALRFTMRAVALAYVHPATHAVGVASTDLPPMGIRLRLKKDFDISGFTGFAAPLLRAMKTYGLILADRGSDWYITGETNAAWAGRTDDLTKQLSQVHGRDFEIVKSGPVLTTGL